MLWISKSKGEGDPLTEEERIRLVDEIDRFSATIVCRYPLDDNPFPRLCVPSVRYTSPRLKHFLIITNAGID